MKKNVNLSDSAREILNDSNTRFRHFYQQDAAGKTVGAVTVCSYMPNKTEAGGETEVLVSAAFCAPSDFKRGFFCKDYARKVCAGRLESFMRKRNDFTATHRFAGAATLTLPSKQKGDVTKTVVDVLCNQIESPSWFNPARIMPTKTVS